MKAVTAASLGIDLDEAGGYGLYKWLLASFLTGKRIRSSVAVEAYRSLVVRGGLDTPGKLARCPHSRLVSLLGQAGYARYDESTARRLHALGRRLELETAQYLGHGGNTQGEELGPWLLSFEGIGPKTLEIFMRERVDG